MKAGLMAKALKKLPPDTEVGVNVLTLDGSEFWALGKDFKIMDEGKSLAIFEVRRNKGLPKHACLKNIQTVDEAPLDYDLIKEEIDERFEVTNDISEEDRKSFDKDALVGFIFECLHKEIAELIRLNNDLLVYLDKKFMKDYWIETIAQEDRK